MGCSSSHDADCPFPPVPWEKSGTGLLGLCTESMLQQCDVIWPSDVGALTSGAPTDTLNWTVTDVGFSELQPIGLKISVVADDGADSNEIDRLAGFSSIDFQNNNFVPQKGTVTPFSMIAPYCNRALRITELGIIKAGANPVAMDINLLALAYAGTLRVVGTIYARSIRGGNATGYRPVA